MSAIAKLVTVMLDCSDPKALGGFYAQVTGWKTMKSADDLVILDGGHFNLGFQRVDGYEAPGWPDESRKQTHLDFAVDDVAVAVKELTALGATVPEFQPGGDDWTVLADPAGHLFCVFVG